MGLRVSVQKVPVVGRHHYRMLNKLMKTCHRSHVLK